MQISARSLALVGAIGALCACSNKSVSFTQVPGPPSGPAGTGFLRAVHASPDAGNVDIYVYAQGAARPSSPTIANAAYPQITDFLPLPSGNYTIDVLPAGAAATTMQVLREVLTLAPGAHQTAVAAGLAMAKTPTLQFVNFTEPTEIAGQSALVVHHASPFVANFADSTGATPLNPVGVGIYDASALGTTVPAASQTTEVFTFALNPFSGPVTSGAFPTATQTSQAGVENGEFFLSPITGQAGEPTLPTSIGFAAGAAGTAVLSPLGSVAVSANLSQLASGLQNRTAAQNTLAADAASTIPAGAHLSVFAVDTTTAAALIGTLDP